MPDITTSFDSILRRGRVISLFGDMPIVGYNPQQRFERADMVEASDMYERQEFMRGGFFRRDYFFNAAGDTLRISGWFIENPPVVDGLQSVPLTALINSGNVVLTVNGDGFGTDAEQVRVLFRWSPSQLQGAGGGRKAERVGTITAIADEQITCTMNFDQEWRHSGLSAGAHELVVQRLDLGIESDPMVFSLTGG